MRERKRLWIPEWESATEPPAIPNVIELTMPAMHCSIGGYFYVDLIDAKTGRVKQHLEFPNLIVDAGMDSIGSQSPGDQFTLFAYLGVGTSATAPTVSDTTLGAEVDRTNDAAGFGGEEITGGPITGSGHTFDTPYHFKRLVRLFTETEGNGNLTELGWFNAASAGTMVVRSLFRDTGGTPVTVVKTSSDQLKVTYELRMYPPVGQNPTGSAASGTFSPISSGTVILGSTTHSWTSSGLNIFNQGGWGWSPGGGGDRGALDGTLTSFLTSGAPSASTLINPTGSADNFNQGGGGLTLADTNVQAAYVAGTFQRDMLSTWNPGDSRNFPGFVVRISNWIIAPADFHFQFFMSESVQFTSLDRLRVNFRFKFDRAVFS